MISVDYKDLFLSFLTGSCYFVFSPFFHFVNKMVELQRLKTNYYEYTMIMPFYFGVLNVVFNLIQKLFKWSDLTRFISTAVFGIVAVISVITYFDLYNYNKSEWINHYLGLIAHYTVVWVILIMFFEKWLRNRTYNKKEKYYVGSIAIAYFVWVCIKNHLKV